MMNRPYSLHDYKMDLAELLKYIRKSGKQYDLIMGIQRGGLIPGVHLSHALGVPFNVIQWSNNGVKESANPHLICNKGKNILLVDDICDSGVTLKEILFRYAEWNLDTAVLIYNNINPHGVVPTYYGWEMNRNDVPQWFDFWWEQESFN